MTSPASSLLSVLCRPIVASGVIHGLLFVGLAYVVEDSGPAEPPEQRVWVGVAERVAVELDDEQDLLVPELPELPESSFEEERREERELGEPLEPQQQELPPHDEPPAELDQLEPEPAPIEIAAPERIALRVEAPPVAKSPVAQPPVAQPPVAQPPAVPVLPPVRPTPAEQPTPTQLPPRQAPPREPPVPARTPRRPRRVALRAIRRPDLTGFYPYQARVRNIEGTARVRIHVTPQGLVGQAELVRSSGYPMLDRAAIAAARAYRFEPPGIAQTRTIPVVFQLTGRP